MCGILGALTQQDAMPILLEGLKRLEYRGYDSAGMAVIHPETHAIQRLRTEGKVAQLENALNKTPLMGTTGIAHTRWATHGKPCEINAHPIMSGDDLAIVHNGIIENHDTLRAELIKGGYTFHSATDTEVIAHLIHRNLNEGKELLDAVMETSTLLKGAFALGIISRDAPQRLIAVRHGSPLVMGLCKHETFIASDPIALFPVTDRFIYLNDGDIADIRHDGFTIFDHTHKKVERQIHTVDTNTHDISRGDYEHFMQKEIFEQPNALNETLEGRLSDKHVPLEIFGVDAETIFSKTKRIHIVSCGTSYHASLVGKYWLEDIAAVPCHVEIASEYRYRNVALEEDTLFITISQSGETADTLAALHKAKKLPYLAHLAICNVPQSSLVRESDYVFMTRAGTEIGVASTKAFTTQLSALLMLTLALSKVRQQDAARIDELTQALRDLPSHTQKMLEFDSAISALAHKFQDKKSTLFLGRGIHYPIAMEGALKLKELSYIHAEAYPAGELKHGPLALIDEDMLVIAIAPSNDLFSKSQSNLNEVRTRGGQMIIFTDDKSKFEEDKHTHVIEMPKTHHITDAIMYTIPLQLLAYHVALMKGTDVDQPRNLAKSVTVE